MGLQSPNPISVDEEDENETQSGSCTVLHKEITRSRRLVGSGTEFHNDSYQGRNQRETSRSYTRTEPVPQFP